MVKIKWSFENLKQKEGKHEKIKQNKTKSSSKQYKNSKAKIISINVPLKGYILKTKGVIN